MFVVLVGSILALLLTILESKGILKYGMQLGFLLITIIAVFRYDYGTDYLSYLEDYEWIVSAPFSLQRIINVAYHGEIGWPLLSYLCKYLGGFYTLIAIVAIVQNTLYYRVIKHGVPQTLWPIAVFIYLFNVNFYLLNCSMLRQGLIIAVFLSLWPYIQQKKWLPTVLILLLCTLIHQTAFILLPFAFFGFLPTKNGKIWAVILCVLYLISLLGEPLLRKVFFFVVGLSDDLQRYQNDYGVNGGGLSLGMGYMLDIIGSMMPIVVCLFMSKNRSTNQLMLLFGLTFCIEMLRAVTPLAVRLSFYFLAYSIIALPIAYANIKNKKIALALFAAYVFVKSYDYFIFFDSPIWTEKYCFYQTILGF